MELHQIRSLLFQIPPKLRSLIMSWISSSSISILVNGEKTPYFNPTRGIRQGDPLFPYLFIMCMELLSRRIDHEIDILHWNPITINKKSPGPLLSYLFFVDDLILFAKANKGNCNTIKNTMNSFSLHSGQKINFLKSKFFFSKNSNPDTKTNLARILNIQVKEEFGKYLGFPNLL